MLDGMTTWTFDEAVAQVYMSLPEGWGFKRTSSEGYHTASIVDDQAVEVWTCEEPLPDPRMIALEAYGWLYAQKHQVQHPKWVRHHEIDRHQILGKVGLPGISVPDPGDLDPAEIDEMYKNHR